MPQELSVLDKVAQFKERLRLRQLADAEAKACSVADLSGPRYNPVTSDAPENWKACTPGMTGFLQVPTCLPPCLFIFGLTTTTYYHHVLQRQNVGRAKRAVKATRDWGLQITRSNAHEAGWNQSTSCPREKPVPRHDVHRRDDPFPHRPFVAVKGTKKPATGGRLSNEEVLCKCCVWVGVLACARRRRLCLLPCWPFVVRVGRCLAVCRVRCRLASVLDRPRPAMTSAWRNARHRPRRKKLPSSNS